MPCRRKAAGSMRRAESKGSILYPKDTCCKTAVWRLSYIRHFHNVPHRFEIHVVNAYGQSVLRKLVVHRLDAPRKFALAARFGRFDKVRRIGYNQVCLNPLLEHFLDAEQTVHIIDLVDFQSFTSHTVRDGMRGIIAHIGVHKQRRID